MYYGYGQGKTSASLGLCIRCVGRGYRVLFVPFLKKSDSGEYMKDFGFECLKPKIEPDFWYKLSDDEKDIVRAEAHERLLLAFSRCKSEGFDMIVLDEIIDAVEVGCIDQSEVCSLINNRPGNLEVIMTGHGFIKSLADISDYITEMREIRHPYSKGTGAREGIEK